MKKSQITIFMILGIVVLSAFGFLFFAGGQTTTASMDREINNLYTDYLSTSGVRDFVTQCLDLATKNGLHLLGKQGGRIYEHQYLANPDVSNLVEYGNGYIEIDTLPSNYIFPGLMGIPVIMPEGPNISVSYGLHAPELSFEGREDKYGDSHYDVPQYPYEGEVLGSRTEPAPYFGKFSDALITRSNLLSFDALCKRGGPNDPWVSKAEWSCETYTSADTSAQDYLEDYITVKFKDCADISPHRGQGYTIDVSDQVEITVLFGEDDVFVEAELPILIYTVDNPPLTKILNFNTREKNRMKKMHELALHLLGYKRRAEIVPNGDAFKLDFDITTSDSNDCETAPNTFDFSGPCKLPGLRVESEQDYCINSDNIYCRKQQDWCYDNPHEKDCQLVRNFCLKNQENVHCTDLIVSMESSCNTAGGSYCPVEVEPGVAPAIQSYILGFDSFCQHLASSGITEPKCSTIVNECRGNANCYPHSHYSDMITIYDDNNKLRGSAFEFKFMIENRIPVLQLIDRSLDGTAYEKTSQELSPDAIHDWDQYNIFIDLPASGGGNEILEISPEGIDPDGDGVEFYYGIWGHDDVPTGKSTGPVSFNLDFTHTGSHRLRVFTEDNEGLVDWQDVLIQARCDNYDGTGTTDCCLDNLSYANSLSCGPCRRCSDSISLGCVDADTNHDDCPACQFCQGGACTTFTGNPDDPTTGLPEVPDPSWLKCGVGFPNGDYCCAGFCQTTPTSSTLYHPECSFRGCAATVYTFLPSPDPVAPNPPLSCGECGSCHAGQCSGIASDCGPCKECSGGVCVPKAEGILIGECGECDGAGGIRGRSGVCHSTCETCSVPAAVCTPVANPNEVQCVGECGFCGTDGECSFFDDDACVVEPNIDCKSTGACGLP